MKDYSYISENTSIQELPGIWPVGNQLDSILSQVIQYHPHLECKLIIFLFKKTMKYGGTAQICSKQIKAILDIYDTDADFIVCLNWQNWIQLSTLQKKALLDHELEHCKYDADDKPITIDHDLEEFACIVERHGLWSPGLQRMEQSMQRRRPVKSNGKILSLAK